MQLHLHPTRREALTASETALTRWSLATNPATILAQMPYDPAPESVFSYMYSPNGHLHTYGGVTGSPDGLLFAMQQLNPERYRSPDPCVMEWRSFDDFSLAHASSVPQTCGEIGSLACSPDGRWLVLECAERLFLLDWQTGELLSTHATGMSYTNCLTFDATSTFLAQTSYSDGAFLHLWRLDSAERFVPRPQEAYYWPAHQLVPQDQVSGNMALTLLYVDWDRLGIAWPNRYLADAPGCVAFSPDSRILLFSLHSTIGVGGCALVAFEVPSGKLLWGTHAEMESSGQPIFSPDGSILLVPVEGGDLLVYRVEDGSLVQRLSTGLTEPIQALTFDHNGRTLWLATEENLVQYQPRG